MACKQFFRSLKIALYTRIGSITIQAQSSFQNPLFYAINAINEHVFKSSLDFKHEPILEPSFEFGALSDYNHQPENPLNSLADSIWNFSTPTRRRSKQRRTQIRMGFYGHQEFYQLKRSLITCNNCGHWHERHTLCSKCYSTVREETEKLRALAGTLPTEFYQHTPEVRSFESTPPIPSRVPPQAALELRREASPPHDREWRFLYENDPEPPTSTSSKDSAGDAKSSHTGKRASKKSAGDAPKPSLVTTPAAYFIRVPYARPDWFKPRALPSTAAAQSKPGAIAPAPVPASTLPLFSWGDGRKFVKRPRMHPRRWVYKTLHP